MTASNENDAWMTIKRVLAVAAEENFSAIVGASAGIAVHNKKESVHQLLERADKALYVGKRGGGTGWFWSSCNACSVRN